MNYWDGKCFFCIFWSTLVLIVALSASPIYEDIKVQKRKKKIPDTTVRESTLEFDSVVIRY
jgi:hypothetical protein